MTSRRQERIAEVLTEELGLLIASELTDPRLEDAMITVTDVQVSPDLGNARVYIQHALPAAQSRNVLSALKHSTTFLRRALVENLHLRVVPELHFVVDETEKRAHRIDEILDRIAAEHHAPEAKAPGGNDGQTTTRQENHADADERSAQ
ncbi:MAG: 30S ribosome-binding factor RbfA [Nitrososphaerales archaeon]